MSTKTTKTYKSIVAQINSHIKHNSILTIAYNRWYVGITCDVDRRISEHLKNYPDLKFIFSHYARKKDIAREIEDFFSGKGTLNNPVAGNCKEDSWYVYVFKAYPTFWD